MRDQIDALLLRYADLVKRWIEDEYMDTGDAAELLIEMSALLLRAQLQLLDEREHAAVLAALRFWQRYGNQDEDCPEYDIATNGGQFEAMRDDEIDELCERLNMPACAVESSDTDPA